MGLQSAVGSILFWQPLCLCDSNFPNIPWPQLTEGWGSERIAQVGIHKRRERDGPQNGVGRAEWAISEGNEPNDTADIGRYNQ